MDRTDEEEADTPRTRLYRIVARLLRAHEVLDMLARKSSSAEPEMGRMPADLLAALSDAERVLLDVEAEVLDAVYAVIAADPKSNVV